MNQDAPARRTLVTGEAGFIGSRLLRRLPGEGWGAVARDALKPGRCDFLSEGADLMVG